MVKRFECVLPTREKPSFLSFPVVEKDGEFVEFRKSSESVSLTNFDVQEPFLLWNPEYAFSPNLRKKYPVILGDWNLNFPIFLQNMSKYSIVFVDGVGAKNLERRIQPKVVGAPIFILYVSAGIKEEPVQTLKNRKIDVLFLGNQNPGIHEKRNRLLKLILNLPENYRIVVGSGLYDEELYSQILSKSKIVFNFSVRKEMNMRVFEALRTACCMFLEDDNIETWQYVKKHKDAVPYTEDKLIDLVIHYIQNDEEREKVALSGYESIKKITKSTVYRRIWDEMKEDAFSPRTNLGSDSDISSFRSFINHLFNFPICISEENLQYAESWGISISEECDAISKSCLLSDLSFLYLISAIKIDTDKKRYLEKSIRYLNSALAFNPRSLIVWYNHAMLNYSMGNRRDFQLSCSNFFKSLNELPYDESMKEVKGYPEISFPFVFSQYTTFKSYIDMVWFQNFEKTDVLRRETAKTLLAQVAVFLANFALENQDHAEAEKFCLLALGLFPNLSELYYLLGKIKMSTGEFKESVRAYLRAYELNPLFFTKWPEILSALLLAGDKQKLEEVLQEMTIMSKRLYVFNGSTINFSTAEHQHKIAIRSIHDLIREYLLQSGTDQSNSPPT